MKKFIRCMEVWRNRGKERAGFTLMELIATITIVVVLSVISGPIYNSYAGKARMTEGYALIGTIRSAQEKYYGEYNRFFYLQQYLYGTCNDEVLGIDARPNKYYTKFIPNSWVDGGVAVVKEGFIASVQGENVPTIALKYNRTTGITVY